MPAPESLKMKVCIVGDPNVGKSSVVRHFVLGGDEDADLPAHGATVSKKEVAIRVGGCDVLVILTIWDITTEDGARGLTPDAWLSRAQGVLAVADVTRPSTVAALSRWVMAARSASGNVPIVLLGNKADLADGSQEEDLDASTADLGLPSWLTSARTGRGIREAFQSLVEAIALARMPRAESVSASPLVVAA